MSMQQFLERPLQAAIFNKE